MTERKLDKWEEAALKKAYIQIRIEESLKNDFYSKCKENFQTPSVVLRGLIKKFVKEMDAEKIMYARRFKNE